MLTWKCGSEMIFYFQPFEIKTYAPVFQIRGLYSFLSLCYVCNSEVIRSIIHLQSANFIKLSHAGSIPNNEHLFHLTHLRC